MSIPPSQFGFFLQSARPADPLTNPSRQPGKALYQTKANGEKIVHQFMAATAVILKANHRRHIKEKHKKNNGPD
jgi:hypothetical protein